MASKPVKNMTVQQTYDRAWWPLILLFFAVIVIVSIFLVWHYSKKSVQHSLISSFVFSANTGPVSPEFQSSKVLTISPTVCQYVVVVRAVSNTTNCTLSAMNFNAIIDSYYSNKIENAINTNNQNPSSLIGGPQNTMTVNPPSTSALTTKITQSFKTDAQLFFNTVAVYVPEFSNLNF